MAIDIESFLNQGKDDIIQEENTVRRKVEYPMYWRKRVKTNSQQTEM